MRFQHQWELKQKKTNKAKAPKSIVTRKMALKSTTFSKALRPELEVAVNVVCTQPEKYGTDFKATV